MLRHWFSLRNLRMPSTAWLSEMLTQLVEARDGAQMLVTHPDCHIRRHRDRLHITPKLDDLAGTRSGRRGVRQGSRARPSAGRAKPSMAFPAYGGVLHFEPPARAGLDPGLAACPETADRLPAGGERLKPAPTARRAASNIITRRCNVPAWERAPAGGQRAGAVAVCRRHRHGLPQLGSGPGRWMRLRWEAV
jgi:tRNA(Ile)-lysidine synthase